jgi:hypothetical protein
LKSDRQERKADRRELNQRQESFESNQVTESGDLVGSQFRNSKYGFDEVVGLWVPVVRRFVFKLTSPWPNWIFLTRSVTLMCNKGRDCSFSSVFRQWR